MAEMEKGMSGIEGVRSTDVLEHEQAKDIAQTST
jgi:hypothetical protein